MPEIANQFLRLLGITRNMTRDKAVPSVGQINILISLLALVAAVVETVNIDV